MDVLARLLTGGLQAATPGPADDFWYGPVGTMTAAGIKVDADGAKKLSAWYRGRDILATSLAMLPLHLYQRLPNDEGSDKATGHYLYDALHRKPHPQLAGDSFTWRRQAMFDLIDYGWSFDLIDVQPSYWGFRRLDPRLVTVEVIEDGAFAGRFLFHVRNRNSGAVKTYTQDDVFYRMASDGKGILDAARDSLGLAKATETYAAKVYGYGVLNGGIIETPAAMDREKMRSLAESFKTAAGDWHMPKVLPFGAKYQKDDGLTPERAQMLLSRKFSINDIARWLGLPPHMLGDLDRATFSNIEHQGQEFVTYSLGPWLSLWEFAINDQLILQPGKFYAEFTRDALVRGDIATRWQAHVEAVNAGIKTVDEVRVVENLNRRGGKADELREPQNITGKPTAQAPRKAPADTRAMAIATASAARVLRKEVKRVQALAVRYAANQDEFAAAVSEFYAEHVELVEAELMLPDAAGYCAGQAAQIVSGDWVEAIRRWETAEYAAGLASLALEGEAA